MNDMELSGDRRSPLQWRISLTLASEGTSKALASEKIDWLVIRARRVILSVAKDLGGGNASEAKIVVGSRPPFPQILRSRSG